MSVSPASFANGATFSPELYSVDDADTATSATPPEVPEEQPARGADASASAINTGSGLTSMLAGIEQQFSVMMKRFGQELTALERRMSALFRSLAAPAPRLPHAPVAAGSSAPTRSERISPYDGLIRRAAKRYEIDPELVGAVIRQESGFQESARSPAGAMGLMQLMPDTARDLGVTDPFDAEQNVDGGTRFLRSLIDRYGGRVDLALAAYNAGPGAVDRYRGIPPYAQTQDYVRDVMTSYRAAVLGR